MTRRLPALRDRAAFVSVVAVLLMMPPLLLVADHPVLVMGLPLLYVWVFGWWVVLIVGGALLSRALTRAEALAHLQQAQGPAHVGPGESGSG